MKRTLAILAVLGLVLVGCGDTPAPEAATEQPQLLELGQESTLNLLAPGQPINFPLLVDELITVGFQDTFEMLRHANGLARTSLFNTENSVDPLFRADATWRAVAGLAGSEENTCFSFESLNFPGQYLRHSASRVRKDADDGSAGFKADATWCLRGALNGAEAGFYSFESFNFPGYYLRRFNTEIWIATPEQGEGARPQNTPENYERDVSWQLFAPLAEAP